MICATPTGTEEQRGQSLGWYPNLCQHTGGTPTACPLPATHRLTADVHGVIFQSWVCDHHAQGWGTP